MSEEQPLLRSGEAARYLGLSKTEFNRRVNEGQIPYAKEIPSKWRRYRKSDLDAYRQKWKEEREVKPEQL
jgi:excisionase family DNA binding protein